MSPVALTRLTPFQIAAPDAALEDLNQRLGRYRPAVDPTGADWRYGVNAAWLAELIDYWRTGFSWRDAEARLNRHAHYRARLTPVNQPPLDVHLIVAPAARADAPVVLLTPGWPSSLVEYHELISLLSRPQDFGGDEAEAITVVAAELPGFGLSGRPAAPLSHRAMADLWRQLMVEVLGVDRFFMHGGDWGAVVGSWLALDHPEHVAGLHLSMLGLRPAIDRDGAPLTDEEKTWLGATKARLDADGGYAELQASKPSTLAVGLVDSPAALSAWLIEKYHGWSGAGASEPPPMDRDQLLTAVTLYWTLGDLPAANWIYWADRNLGGIALKPGERVAVPTGLALFGQGFFPIAPRAWAERAYNVTAFDTFPRGGHFPAWLEPNLVASSLMGFIRRTAG